MCAFGLPDLRQELLGQQRWEHRQLCAGEGTWVHVGNHIESSIPQQLLAEAVRFVQQPRQHALQSITHTSADSDSTDISFCWRSKEQDTKPAAEGC